MKTFAASVALALTLTGLAAADVPVSSGNIINENFDNYPASTRSAMIGDGATLEANAAHILTTDATEGVFRVARAYDENSQIIPYPAEYVVEFDFTLKAPASNFYILYAESATNPWFTAIALRTLQDAPGSYGIQVDHGTAPFYEQFYGFAMNQSYHLTVHVQPGPTKPVDFYVDGLLMGTYASRNPSLTTDLVQWGDPSGGPDTYGDAIVDNVKVGGIPGEEPIPGDFDENGYVDGDDMAEWEGDFGAGGGSDADDDGDSDGNDFLIWQRQVGQGIPPNVATVPEPGASALVGVALLGCSRLVRKSRRR